MNALPVIERELRAEARHAFTYWLRVLGAAALLAVAAVDALERGLPLHQGRELFQVLSNALFAAIWIFVPLVTADCVSCERREGTLGLLFLTPLRAGDIVLAKGLAHGLRAAVIGLAVLPLLMGGVSRVEVMLVVLAHFVGRWARGCWRRRGARCGCVHWPWQRCWRGCSSRCSA